MSIDKGFQGVIKKCEICDSDLPKRAKRFCSYNCYWESKKMVPIKVNCLRCGKEYLYRQTKHTNYCSNKCRHRNAKYQLDHSYFKSLTSDKIITMGQIMVIGWHTDWRTLHLQSDLSTLEDISKKLGSTYPIKKSDKGLHQIVIWSEEMVSDLIEFGLSKTLYYNEIPTYDFKLILEGIRRTHCWDGEKYRLKSFRVSMEIVDKLGGVIKSETYKDVYKGKLGIDYLVYL